MIAEALFCLALNIYHEARGEPLAAQANVATVTMNRVRDVRFPDTVCAVVKQENRRGCQFSWWCDRNPDAPTDRDAWWLANQIAGLVLNGSIVDRTDGALYYHTHDVWPRWAAGMPITKIDAGHVFHTPDRRRMWP